MNRRNTMPYRALLFAAAMAIAGPACGFLGSSEPPAGITPATATSPTPLGIAPVPSPSTTPLRFTPTPILTPPQFILVNDPSELSPEQRELPQGWRVDQQAYLGDTYLVVVVNVSRGQAGKTEMRVTVFDSAKRARDAMTERRQAAAQSPVVQEAAVGEESFAHSAEGRFTAQFRVRNVVSEVTTFDESGGSFAETESWALRLKAKIDRMGRMGLVRQIREPTPVPLVASPSPTQTRSGLGQAQTAVTGTAVPAPPAATATPSPTPAPTAAAAPTSTSTPVSPTPSPTPTPTRTAPAPPASPTPTPTPTPLPPPPPGYIFASAEHAFALVQTTRNLSSSRPGWADITVDLVVTKFRGDTGASRIELSVTQQAICFLARTDPHDCVFVIWGTGEQFQADVTPNPGEGRYLWPMGKAWPFSLRFQLPVNTERASLNIGGLRVPLDVTGDPRPSLEGRRPSSAPTPPLTPGGAAGSEQYFMAGEYGVAIASLGRRPDTRLKTWTEVTLGLVVAVFPEVPGLAPPLRVLPTPEGTCFGAAASPKCVRVHWGPERTYDAVLTLRPTAGEVPWPRGMSWPASITFLVPENAQEATLAFGDHRIALDLFGMSGAAPTYDYRAHYPELKVGDVVYALNGKTVSLSGVQHNATTGAMVLELHASNRAENLDFAPVLVGRGARVSRSGRVFDGLDSAAAGWTPAPLRAEGPVLAPGFEGVFQLEVPRVAGGGFRSIELGPEPPDAVVLELGITDAAPRGQPQAARVGHVPFEHPSFERRFWLPDLSVERIQWEPAVPTVGGTVKVTVTVANLAPFGAAPASSLALDVGGQALAEVELPGIAAGKSAKGELTWTATGGPDTFGAAVDAAGRVEERDKANNRKTAFFGGAFLPDLVVDDMRWKPAQPSVGAIVTFTVSVKNQGKGVAGPAQANVFLDGDSTPRWTLSYTGIEGGRSDTRTFTWEAMEGPHTFKVVADTLGAVLETDETNNLRLFSYGSTVLADLTVKVMTWSPKNPSVGDTVIFTPAIENTGPGDAASFRLHVFLDAATQPAWNPTVPGLKAGQTTTQAFSWTALAGGHDFRVFADGARVVPETDESNNERTFHYEGTLLPDLTVAELSWSPVTPSLSDNVTFTVKVANLGAGGSPPFALHVFLDGASTPTWNLPFQRIAEGNSATQTFSWTALAGRHTFRTVADAVGDAPEADETNNERTSIYNTTLLPDLVVDAVTWDPRVPLAGESVKFAVTAKNQGLGASPAFQVRVTVDGVAALGWTLSFARLEAGLKATLPFTWASALAGSHTFRLVADAPGVIAESDETNNVLTVAVP